MRVRFHAVFIVLLLLAPSLSSAQQFADVTNTRYASAFSYLSERGVISGINQMGQPDAPLTRAEALKVIVALHPGYASRLQWFVQHMPPIALFTDVDQSSWYAPYLETTYEAGLVTGHADHTFRPSSPIAAEEAIVLLLRSYGVGTANGGATWYQSYVSMAFTKNLLSSKEQLYLGVPLTRGQFFDMAYRLDVVTRGNLVAFSDPSTGPSLPSSLVALPTNPSGIVPSSKPFAITIPALGIADLTVTHPSDPLSSDGLLAPLRDGVGQLFGYPGGGGKIMIYGHSSGYPWDVSKYTKIFRKVNALKQGDLVYVTYQGKLYTYQVSFKETVSVDDMQPFSGDGEELILYTCWPPDSISKRYLVHALPVNE